MTPEETYQVWAPAESIWSPWTIPVPFAQMVCAETKEPPDLSEAEKVAAAFDASPELGIVVDLPGGQAVKVGLALARRGFRPVPVIDGSPGPGVFGLNGLPPLNVPAEFSRVAVDMRELLSGLCRGVTLLRSLTISPEASPAFLLDAMRAAQGRVVGPDVFDNRWKTFPQDYPSARFLQDRGIQRVVLIQENAAQPQEDLAHVLLRWQEAGIHLRTMAIMETPALQELRVSRPSHFRALWQRMLAIFGLRRGSFGGFGNWPHGTGGG